LYWSFMDAAKPTRVWYFSFDYAQGKLNASSSIWHDPEVLDDMAEGEGVVHMYEDLGYFRWAPAEPPAAVAIAEDGRRYMEVLRGGVGGNLTKEDDVGGVWFYALHGTGFWLDLGRELDTTCDRRHVGGVLRYLHPEYMDNTKRSKEALAEYHRDSVKLNCTPTIVESSSAATSVTKSTTSCQMQACRAHSCKQLHGSSAELCIPGREHEHPPMLRSHIYMHRSFESVVKWSPALLHWWGRASPKELIDLRVYGTPRCLNLGSNRTATDPRCAQQPAYLPCGGWEPQRNASSQHIRTGWQAAGEPCSDCVNDRVNLNCGPAQPPAAVHAKSLRAYLNGSGLGPVRGVCLHQWKSKRYRRRNLTAASPVEFLNSSRHMHCVHAYFWWP